MKRVARGLLAVVGAAGLLLAGCEKEDPGSCEYWIKRLQSPGKAKEALVQVGDLKCAAAAPNLKTMFDEGQYQDEILSAVSRIGDKAVAGELLSRAVRIENLTAKAAAIISDLKLTEAKPALVEVLTKPRNPGARGTVLNALLALEPAQANEDTLLQLLSDDPAVQGLEVNVKAADELGKMKSQKAIPALINALFVRTAAKQELYSPARMALVEIGAPAVDPLVSAIKGELETLNAFVKSKNLARWQWQEGPKLAQILGDLRDPKAATAVAGNMAIDLQQVEGLSEALKNEWVQNMTNRLVVGMIALGQIGSDEPADALAALIPNLNERDTSQRLNAATALAFVGTPKAVDALFKAYEAEKDYRFRAAMLLPLSMALDSAHMPVWDGIEEYVKLRKGQETEKDLYYEQSVLKDQLEDKDVGPRLKSYVGTVRECGENATCYQQKLGSEDLSTRMKATLMLTRGAGASDEVFAALLDAFKKSKPDEVDFRRFVLMGLGRRGSQGKAGGILQYSETLRQKGKAEVYWADEMKVLGLYLQRKGS